MTWPRPESLFNGRPGNGKSGHCIPYTLFLALDHTVSIQEGKGRCDREWQRGGNEKDRNETAVWNRVKYTPWKHI